jgi:hypothetical protein
VAHASEDPGSQGIQIEARDTADVVVILAAALGSS